MLSLRIHGLFGLQAILQLALLASLIPGALSTAELVPRQTATQRALVARLTANAKAASAAATPGLLAALADPELSELLRARGLPALAAEPPHRLLARLRAEAAAAELTHNLALGNGTVRRGECAACDAWATGADSSLTRTPLFAMETLPSLWTLGLLGYADADRVANWMRGADAVECGILGCPAFTGELPPAREPSVKPGKPPPPPPPPRPPYWPSSKIVALDRPIYAVLDLNKIDAAKSPAIPHALVRIPPAHRLFSRLIRNRLSFRVFPTSARSRS